MAMAEPAERRRPPWRKIFPKGGGKSGRGNLSAPNPAYGKANFPIPAGRAADWGAVTEMLALHTVMERGSDRRSRCRGSDLPSPRSRGFLGLLSLPGRRPPPRGSKTYITALDVTAGPGTMMVDRERQPPAVGRLRLSRWRGPRGLRWIDTSWSWPLSMPAISAVV